MMECRPLGSLRLYFDAPERETAELVAGACTRSVEIIRENWGLDVPQDCRVYVMTSWLRFMFHAAPWPWRIWMGAMLPLWAWRAQTMWRVAGGFHQAYGRRRAIGVKPAWLMERADRSVGERLFVPEENADLCRKVRHVTCHELTHACTAHLRPPMWLNEGLAMVTVDRLAGQPTIRQDTLEILARASSKTDSARYQSVRSGDRDVLLYHAVRGYWLTRYLDERQPGVLRQLLAQRHDRRTLERLVARSMGLDEAVFWSTVDSILVDQFRAQQPDQTNSSSRSTDDR